MVRFDYLEGLHDDSAMSFVLAAQAVGMLARQGNVDLSLMLAQVKKNPFHPDNVPAGVFPTERGNGLERWENVRRMQL
jgi:hypothetical protein